MHLFWWSATGPLSPVFHHLILAWLFIVLYFFFGEGIRYFYIGSMILLIFLGTPLRNAIKRLEVKYNPRHF